MERVDKINYYLNIWSFICIHFQSIVKNDEIISTGYTGAPRGRKNCIDLGYCRKSEMPTGKGYDKCRSVHSEQNAMLSAARKDMMGATLYMVGINKRNNEYVTDNWPCTFCKRMLINSGIKEVIMRDSKEKYRVEQIGLMMMILLVTKKKKGEKIR